MDPDFSPNNSLSLVRRRAFQCIDTAKKFMVKHGLTVSGGCSFLSNLIIVGNSNHTHDVVGHCLSAAGAIWLIQMCIRMAAHGQHRNKGIVADCIAGTAGSTFFGVAGGLGGHYALCEAALFQLLAMYYRSQPEKNHPKPHLSGKDTEIQAKPIHNILQRWYGLTPMQRGSICLLAALPWTAGGVWEKYPHVTAAMIISLTALSAGAQFVTNGIKARQAKATGFDPIGN